MTEIRQIMITNALKFHSFNNEYLQQFDLRKVFSMFRYILLQFATSFYQNDILTSIKMAKIWCVIAEQRLQYQKAI